MTPSDYTNEKPERLENLLTGVRKAVSKLDAMMRGMYQRVGDLVGHAERIYETLANRQDLPTFDSAGSSNGFLDELDD